MKSRLGIALPLTAAALALGAGTASAAVRVVDNTPASICKKPAKGASAYWTIQSAIDDAAPGDTVVVCPGTYDEQVHIDKDGIKLQSNVTFGATIRSPQWLDLNTAGFSDGSIVSVDGAKNVTVTKFVVQGPVRDGSLIGSGILVTHGATGAKVIKNRVLNTRTDFQDSALLGVGIAFGDLDPEQTEPQAEALGNVASGIAQDNEVSGFGLAGITAVNDGSVVTFARNKVTGDGPSAVFPQIGLAVGVGAKGTLLGNTVTQASHDSMFRPMDAIGAPGIFSDAGILLFGAAPGTTLTSNIAFADDAGIVTLGTQGATLKTNTAKGGDFGFYNDPSSTGNTYKSNKALDNTSIDCLDLSSGNGTEGTGNSWKSNVGDISSPTGICS